MVLLLSFFWGSCTSKHTCNKVLNAAKKGNLFYDLGNTGSVRMDFFDYFTESPHEYISETRSNINIIQYFDSYELLESSELTLDTLHKSIDLKKYYNENDTNRIRSLDPEF